MVSFNTHPTFNGRRTTQFMHSDPAFDTTLHVAHAEWHGIRQCVSYAPGQKLLIPAESPFGENDAEKEGILAALIREVERMNITHVIFQGYSDNADLLLLRLKANFGPDLRCFAINHVTTAQFENFFEMSMITRMLIRKRYGHLDGIASVKQNFGLAFEEFWPKVILNYAPNLPEDAFPGKEGARDIYVPLDPSWRKNMFTNYLAALRVHGADRVNVANFPFGLDGIASLQRLILVGYLRGRELLAQMASSAMLITTTFAECQPMTQLEAMAVGRPALTGPLRLQDFKDDPLMALSTTTNLDDPVLLSRDAQRLFDAATGDPVGMREMIAAHLKRRHELARTAYAEFLELRA